MQYRKFGNLGYEVSLLGMGCMRLPRMVGHAPDSAPVDREKAYELIRYAAQNGVNYFDTAFVYHKQTSEEILGEALEGELRKKVKIATKLPLRLMETDADIRKNLELTLKKLRTDYIDIYIVHMIASNSWEEMKARKICEQFFKFKEEGLVGAVGFSIHGPYDLFKEALHHVPWDMCLLQQNMLDIDYEVTEQAVFDAAEKGLAVAIMEPLRGGGLANAPKSVKTIYDSYDKDRKPAEWAFRHLVNLPQVNTILSGMTTMEQLKENIELFSKPDMIPNCLNDKEKNIIVQARAAYKSIVTVPCTTCDYCMPCPYNVDIPGTFSKYNEGMMFESFDQPRRTYMFQTNGGKSADKCVGCGECEPKCPQKINIIEELKVAHEKLKGWME
ncbi:MAG: aldo/keto reductase [Defluviitaleaceae bacterium]|nr:aldo/keto reductase [Defluviitaleaceae bacterium]